MRKLFTVLAVAGVALLGVSAANAGTLSNAALTLTVQGVVVPLSFSPTGSSTATTATVDAGSAFAGTAANIPLTTNPAATNAKIILGNNGQINATPGGATVTAPISGVVDIQNMAGGMTNTLFTIPLGAGANNTTAKTAVVPYVGTIYVTVVGTGWHVGTVVGGATTVNGVTVNSGVTAMGSFNLGATGNGTVTLVSLSKVQTSGLSVGTSYGPTYLTLTYVPEPGTLLLLGAGIAGLVAVGRKKRSA